ncbi:MAG: hypothetical protein U9N44_01125 [Chloroflexota bacterium]|nr:hypothetical protein [Chloroflexota bacterium]
MGAAKVIVAVVGVLIILGALPLLFGGGALMWAHYALTDDAGFLTTGTVDIDRDSYAIVSTPADIEIDPSGMFWSSELVTLKVEGSSADPSKDIFIGIASESDLDAYLEDVKYDEIDTFVLVSRDISYTTNYGNSSPSSPASQSFWTAFAYGNGTQALEWDIESGTYSLVLMNADGSGDVDMEVVFGLKVPFIFGIGIGLLLGGLFLLALGIVMVVLSLRRPAEPRTPQTPTPKHILTEV